ncbi:MAG: diguanylate cyclase [Gammaproteobacteria bacterium]|nr:diguanylate cyclase [Gammaproteobacteria bacterium]
MGIQYRLALYLSGFTVFLLFALCYAFYTHNNEIELERSLEVLEAAAQDEAEDIENFLIEKTKTVLAIVNADLITRELISSNAEYSGLPIEKRKSQINDLNTRWKETADSEDVFVKSYTNNTTAAYLRKQQQRLPGEFGELFLTNRYGLVVGTSNKLTTLAHEHKYWWQAAFNRGQGRIFFDDRGFDESVQGYVVGIVVPIMQDDQLIGVFKANLNLLGSLKEFITHQHYANTEHTAALVRSGGLIILEQGKEPLTTRVADDLLAQFSSMKSGSIRLSKTETDRLVGYAPIEITSGSAQYGFGGSYGTIDHIYGNTGEHWNIVFYKSMNSVNAASLEVSRWLFQIGLICVVFIGVLSLFIGHRLASPIVSMISKVKNISQGNLDVNIQHDKNDELGVLADSFNQMTNDLKETTVSRDRLVEEVSRSHALESKLREQSIKDELTGLYNRRGFRKLAGKQLRIAERNKLHNFLLYADMDFLKQINDEMGHNTGDSALIDVSGVLKKTFRESDVIARLGGAEFAVLLTENKDCQDIESIENRLLKIIDSFNKISDRPYKLSLSVGIVKCDYSSAWSLDRVMSTADTLMYKQKKIRKAGNIKVIK